MLANLNGDDERYHFDPLNGSSPLANYSEACQNSKILNGILKEELGFQGYVMSDWGTLLLFHLQTSP
jgi:beta-glucosidase-like glycosyl hydrolase